MSRNLILHVAAAAMFAVLPLDVMAFPGHGAERGWPFELAGFTDEDFECLALNVYHEARGESLEGMVAVTQVVLNRVNDPEYPDTPCGVVREDRSGGRGKCQFSWWCDGKSDRPTEEDAWKTARAVVRGILEDERVPWIVPEVKHYVHCDVRQSWLRSMSLYERIGDHCFYRDDDGQYEVAVASLDAPPPEEKPSFALEERDEDGSAVLAYTTSEDDWLQLAAVEDNMFQSFRDRMMSDHAVLRTRELALSGAARPAAMAPVRERNYPVARFFADTLLSAFSFGKPAWARTGGGPDPAGAHPPRREQSERDRRRGQVQGCFGCFWMAGIL